MYRNGRFGRTLLFLFPFSPFPVEETRALETGRAGFKFQHLHLPVCVALDETLKLSVFIAVKWRSQYLVGLLLKCRALSIALNIEGIQ